MGQGNKKRRPGSINKGYGPGSGRGGFGGFKGAGIGGNVGGGFGKNKSPSGKNKSGQGGNNPFSKKGDKGFGDKGQLSFSGLKNFFSGFLGSPANALGTASGLVNQATKAPPSQAKINRFLAKNLDITKLNPSLRVNIDGERLAKGFTSKIPNEKIRNWVNNWTPSALKNLRINHQMYSPTKIKPTDPRYNYGDGSGKVEKMDPKAEKYLEWMARHNPTGMTVSEAKKLYANNLKDGRDTLQQVMKINPANTIPFYALIDDAVQDDKGPQAVKGKTPNVTISKSTSDGKTGKMGPFRPSTDAVVSTVKDMSDALKIKSAKQEQQKAETKALEQQYKNDQAIHNNNKNNMTVKAQPAPPQTDEEFLSGAYKQVFGRDFSKSKGGGQYWLDQMKSNPTTHSRDEVLRMLKGSDEGKKYAASGKVQIGGIDPTKSISSQAGPGTWASHFAPGGVYENQNAAAAATQIAKDVGHTPSEAYFNTGVTDQTGADKTGTTIPKEISDGWWNKFADADAFKKFLNEGKEETPAKREGMGDFMKFMMLMNVMRPGGGGGYGGGGGSQWGYGGLNPGGVQAAYDPVASLTKMGSWFKDTFGSGSGTTTSTVNTK